MENVFLLIIRTELMTFGKWESGTSHSSKLKK